MGDLNEIQLHIREGPLDSPTSPKEVVATNKPVSTIFKHWQWWLMVALCTLFILVGQTVATLLGRFYYDGGGNSMWMATLVQSAGFPLILIPYLLSPSSSNPNPDPRPPLAKIGFIYISLGLMIAGDNLMYSYGLLYLPVSTYSLICASQLGFNVIFAYFFNAQKFTALIFNSVVLLTFSGALLGVHAGSEDTNGLSKSKYPLGFVLTLGASAVFSLILSLMQYTFQNVLKQETFSAVLEMQLCTNLVATCVTVVGLFINGDWRVLSNEMLGFEKGKVLYLMTLIWTAITWQVSFVGSIGLILMVSSLFSNVISTLALPIVPIFAVVFFHDEMDGVKVVAMLIAVWGFLSYIYQHYLDDSRQKKDRRTEIVGERSS